MFTHIWPLVGHFFNELQLFVYTFLSRTIGYLLAFKQVMFLPATYVSRKLMVLKRNLLRSLMRRGNEVASSSGVTVATVSVGLCFSLIPLAPQANDIITHAPSETVLIHNKELSASAAASLASSRLIQVEGGALPSINEVVEHVVEPGDTLYAIAEKYLVPADAIAYVNNISQDAFLHPGDTLSIPPVEGLTHTVKEGESVASLAEKYNVSPQLIVDANVLKPPFNVFAGDMLIIPGGEVPQPAQKAPVVLASAAVQPIATGGLSLETVSAAPGSYIIPTAGKITQYASYYHMALDIAKGCGEPIWAANDGTVIVAGPKAGGYGLTVWLQHGDGRVTQYAHMSQVAASVGQVVSQGQIIGYTGATGIAYGCHLHFVVQQGGRAVNPMSVL